MAGFFAGEAPCISLEKKKKKDFTSSERAGSLVLPHRSTPHGGLAAPGPAEPRRAGRQRQRGPCPPASPLRRQPRGARLPPPPPAAPRARLEPPTGRPGAAAAGTSRSRDKPRALAGQDEQGWRALAGCRPPPPSWTSEGGSGATSAVRIAAASARPAAAGRLAGGSSASPPPRYFPLSRQSRGVPSPICMAQPALGRGSRRGPAIPPLPLLKLRGKSLRPGKRRLLPAEPSREEQGSEKRKSIFIGLAFFSLLTALLPNDIYLTAFDSS